MRNEDQPIEATNEEVQATIGSCEVLRSRQLHGGKTLAVLQEGNTRTWTVLKADEKIVDVQIDEETVNWLQKRTRIIIDGELNVAQKMTGIGSLQQGTFKLLGYKHPDMGIPARFPALDGCTVEDVRVGRVEKEDTQEILDQKDKARKRVTPLLRNALQQGNGLLFSGDETSSLYLVPVTPEMIEASIIDGHNSLDNPDPKLRQRASLLQPDMILLVQKTQDEIKVVSAPWLKQATVDTESTGNLYLDAYLTSYHQLITAPEDARKIDARRDMGKANAEIGKVRAHLYRKLIANASIFFPNIPEQLQSFDLERQKAVFAESLSSYPQLAAYASELEQNALAGQRKRLASRPNKEEIIWYEIHALPERVVESFLNVDSSHWENMLVEYKTYMEVIPRQVETAVLQAGYALLRGESPDNPAAEESNTRVIQRLKDLYTQNLERLYEAQDLNEVKDIVESIQDIDLRRDVMKALQGSKKQSPEEQIIQLEITRHEVARQWARKELEKEAIQLGTVQFNKKLLSNIPNLDHDHIFEEVELGFMTFSDLGFPYQVFRNSNRSELVRVSRRKKQRVFLNPSVHAQIAIEREAVDLHTEADIHRETVKYLGYLPTLAHEASVHLVENIQLKNAQPMSARILAQEIAQAHGLFDVENMTDVLREIGKLPQDARKFKAYVLSELIPQMAVLGSLRFTNNKTPGREQQNNAEAFKTTIIRMIKAYTTKDLHVYSVVCPPYNYEVWGERLTPASPTRHIDGEMLPTVGERYIVVAKTIAYLLGNFAKASGVKLKYTVQTYDGSHGMAGLWEVGEDTLNLYHKKPNGEAEISENLLTAFTQLQQETERAFSPYGIQAEAIGIEGSLVKQARDAYDVFIATFPGLDRLDETSHSYQAVDVFMRKQLGVGVKWLEYYIAEELAFAKDAHIATDYNVLHAALREGLLYLMTQKLVVPNNTILLGLEHTANWMTESIPLVVETLGPVGITMARPYDPTQPEGLSLRQPFNKPINNIQTSNRRESYS